MSDDMDLDEFARLWAETKQPSQHRVEVRRQREARAMSGTTARRARRGETKSLQINIRVSPSQKKRLVAMAASRNLALSELFEAAIEALEGAGS